MLTGQGRAWVFGAHVTTDDILPGRYLDRSNDEVGQFAMAGVSTSFATEVGAGDFIVAGENFGAGSGRESAPYAIAGAGVAGIIAPSFGRVFFRNCINIGLPPIRVNTIDGIQMGDVLEVDLAERFVLDTRTGVRHMIGNLTGISLDILRAGGIVPYTRARQTATRPSREPCS